MAPRNRVWLPKGKRLYRTVFHDPSDSCGIITAPGHRNRFNLTPACCAAAPAQLARVAAAIRRDLPPALLDSHGGPAEGLIVWFERHHVRLDAIFLRHRWQTRRRNACGRSGKRSGFGARKVACFSATAADRRDCWHAASGTGKTACGPAAMMPVSGSGIQPAGPRPDESPPTARLRARRSERRCIRMRASGASPPAPGQSGRFQSEGVSRLRN